MSEWKETVVGKLPFNWEIKTINEISERVSVGYVGITAPYFTNGSEGVPLLRSQNIRNGKLNFDNLAFVTKDFHNKNKKSTLKQGDVIVVRVGENRGDTCILKNEFEEVNCANVVFFRPKKEYGKFIELFLRSSFGQYMLESLTTGSAQGVINTKSIEQINVPIPPVKEAIEISNLLESFEDKIDLLQRQNKTLEALAETIFRQWFVEEAEESWEGKKLGDFGTIICGKTPSKKIQSYFGGEVPFIKIPDMHGKTFLFNTEDSLTEKGANSQANKFLPPKSICVSCIATVGLVAMNVFPSQTNQQINSIIPAKDLYRYFLFLKFKSIKDDLLAMASGGTATDNLNTGDFSRILINKPDDNFLKKFHEQVEPFFDKIYLNQTQIQTLTQLRDTLLPKLMSGEVRVI